MFNIHLSFISLLILGYQLLHISVYAKETNVSSAPLIALITISFLEE
jgi:hypothetical protein